MNNGTAVFYPFALIDLKAFHPFAILLMMGVTINGFALVLFDRHVAQKQPNHFANIIEKARGIGD